MSQVVMITGASAGVGRAVARAFGARGASVGLLARGRAGLEGAARDVQRAGGRAVILQADVADAGRVEAAAAHLEETFGAIDVWINNAMASVFSPVLEMEPSDFKCVTDVASGVYRAPFDYRRGGGAADSPAALQSRSWAPFLQSHYTRVLVRAVVGAKRLISRRS
jgi:NAD(P)-dependent dehydrogenase (short-subunit alcohol dehydrogenase family)